MQLARRARTRLRGNLGIVANSAHFGVLVSSEVGVLFKAVDSGKTCKEGGPKKWRVARSAPKSRQPGTLNEPMMVLSAILRGERECPASAL